MAEPAYGSQAWHAFQTDRTRTCTFKNFTHRTTHGAQGKNPHMRTSHNAQCVPNLMAHWLMAHALAEGTKRVDNFLAYFSRSKKARKALKLLWDKIKFSK